jgi:hypothetical protein
MRARLFTNRQIAARIQIRAMSAILPHPMSPMPAILSLCNRVGSVFSASTHTVIAAIQTKFITPPTNSKHINAQQQPRHEMP